jgi:hypothetical protein
LSKKKRASQFLEALKDRQEQVYSRRVVRPTATSVRNEVSYICKLASRGDSHVVGFGKLVFFSTQTCDAWMLDWEDEFAICLMRDRVLQRVELGETPRRFVIQWQGRYWIDGELFNYAGSETPTRVRTIYGYPTEGIIRTINRMRRAA